MSIHVTCKASCQARSLWWHLCLLWFYLNRFSYAREEVRINHYTFVIHCNSLISKQRDGRNAVYASAMLMGSGGSVMLVTYPFLDVWVHAQCRQCIQVVGKKAHRYTRQDRKVAWVFTGILHIGLEEKYKFVFLHVENLFFQSGGLYL